MSDRTDLARGWLRKAASDLDTARLVAKAGESFDTACFHVQQAIEKALKAILVFADAPVPRIHDLDRIHQLCLAVSPELALPECDLGALTQYAAAMRYDVDFWPERESALEAIELAEEILKAILAVLPGEGAGDSKAS
ncbi:MAG: HEPN domain-containing protein [bacterium]|nr:HEPN domain-containing protein [bacterium]